MSSTNGAVVPAAPPPAGVTPNFENPESSSHQLIIVSVVFPVFSFFFLIPRLYSASFIIRKWHLDDYLICVAAAFGLANAILCIIQSTMGMGKHIWELDQETFKETMKIMMLGGALTYNLTTMFIKLSILSFYLRFSVERSFRIAVYLVMFIAFGYSIPNAFLFLYVCRPIPSYWDWAIQGTCINQQAIFDASNILNMVTDFMILLLPFWMLRPLRLPLSKKLGIGLILAAGGFVCGVSTMRMVTGITGAGNMDITWHYPVNLIWCLVEEYIGLICACLPCLKAFVSRFYPSCFVFSPDFDKRIAASFPFLSHSSINDSNTHLNGNGGNGGHEKNGTNATASGDGENKNDGGRRAWWRLRGAGVCSGISAGPTKTGSKVTGTAGSELRSASRPCSSFDVDVEAAKGQSSEKTRGAVPVTEEEEK